MKTIITILLFVVIIGALILLFASGQNKPQMRQKNIQNVTVVDGKQIIEIKAKGGYIPRISTAKAGIPTIVRFDTNGTFDCSASVRISSMNIFEMLPNSGSKDIYLGAPSVGKIQGSCGMGMYPFEINFQS